MLDRVIKEGASDKGKFNYMIRVEETESHSVVSNSLRPHALYSPWNSPGQDIGVGSHSPLQGIFPTHESNPGLPQCRRILYQLSHQGSPTSSRETIFERNTSKTFFCCCFLSKLTVQPFVSFLIRGVYVNNFLFF